MKYAFTLAALAFASVTLGAAIPKERPDCGSPFSPPCPPAVVEKRQGFIGIETGHYPRSTDETAKVPDCGSPFSPPCPPKEKKSIDDTANLEERQGFIGIETGHYPREEAEYPDCGSPFSPPCPPQVQKREEAEVPDCGSPFSPPCPPKAERQIFEGPWHQAPPTED